MAVVGLHLGAETVKPVAGWRLADMKNGVVSDFTGNGHIAHSVNVPVKGKSGIFNGRDSYLEVTAVNGLDFPNGFSVDAKVKINRVMGNRGQVIVSRSLDDVEKDNWVLTWGYNTDMWWSHNTTHNMVGIAPAGQWQHLTMVVSMGGYVVELYVNGVSAGRSIRTKPLGNPAQPLRIGRRGGGDFLEGEIEQVTLYNGPLTANQVESLFRGEPLPEAKFPVTITPTGEKRSAGEIEMLGSWRKILPEPDNYYSYYLAIKNNSGKVWKPVNSWINGQFCGDNFVNLDNTMALVRGVVCEPEVIPPGGSGIVAVKIIASGKINPPFDMSFIDNDGKQTSFKAEFAPSTARFEGMFLNNDLTGGLVYLRGTPGDKIPQIKLYAASGDFPEVKITHPDKIPATGVAKISFDWEVAVERGTFVNLFAKDMVAGWFRLYPSTFPIGMMRVHKSVVNPDWKPQGDRAWMKDYMDQIAVINKDSYAPPAEWLEDCRRHLIDVIAPDFCEYQGDPSVLSKYGQTATPLANKNQMEKFRNNPQVSAWYGTDEPSAGIPPAKFADDMNAIRQRDVTRPVWLTINTPSFPRADMFECVDVGCLDYYPVPTVDLYATGKLLNEFREIIAPRPLIFVPQAWRRSPNPVGPGWSRFPTPEEERYMIYSGLAAGVRGLVYFSYNIEPSEPVEGISSKAPQAVKLWKAIGELNLEVKTVAPWILKSVPLGTARCSVAKMKAVSLLADDCVLVVMLNEDSDFTVGGFTLRDKKNVSFKPVLPSEFPENYQGWEIRKDGIVPVSQKDKKITVKNPGAATMLLLTPKGSDAEKTIKENFVLYQKILNGKQP